MSAIERTDRSQASIWSFPYYLLARFVGPQLMAGNLLVNNAGIGYFAAVEESDEDEVRKMFDVNVFGTGRMIWAVLPGMRKRKAGRIVNLSSLAGLLHLRQDFVAGEAVARVADFPKPKTGVLA